MVHQPFACGKTKNSFFSLICFIISHAFSRIDYYVKALIERHTATYCRWIKQIDGLPGQNMYKTRRFVMNLTTLKNTFLLFNIVKCYVSARALS